VNPAWIEIIGWLGTVLVVVSLMLPSVRKFRWTNLAGSVIATAYNGIFGIWPFFAMNLAIVLIDVYWIYRIERDRAQRRYSLVPMDPEEPYLRHFLDAHRDDVAEFYPGYRQAPATRRLAFLILHRDETIGVVLARVDGDRAVIDVDLVTRRFRDQSPGRFLYESSGAFRDLGLTSIAVPVSDTVDLAYFGSMGFGRRGDELIRSA
jgi:hypothetical protein